MRVPEIITQMASHLMRSGRGQTLLAKTVSELDLWQGYGAGANLASSGEVVLFRLLNRMALSAEPKVIFDVGANVGDFSAAAFDRLKTPITVHAFEPAKGICRDLSARFTNDDRVVINNLALGREPGEQPLYGTRNDSGMASLLNRNLNHVGTVSTFQEMAKVCRLSDYCDSHQVEQIDLLKMDVEGFELEVLAGGRSLFEQGRVRMCSFEFGGCNLDSRTFLRDYFDFFTNYNMKISRITPAGTLASLPHYRESLEKFTTTNYVALSNGINY